MACISNLIQLFEDINVCITSSTVIDIYNPNKLTFFKIDWSAEGMSWILIQPSDDT